MGTIYCARANAAGKDDAAVFAEGDDLVHRLFGVFHGEVPPI